MHNERLRGKTSNYFKILSRSTVGNTIKMLANKATESGKDAPKLDKLKNRQSITRLFIVLLVSWIAAANGDYFVGARSSGRYSLAYAEVEDVKLQKTKQLLRSALSQVGVTNGYDPAYQRIPYPGGDVPLSSGVCTDVIIRALRAADIDLQQLVHEDMKEHFSAYPKLWGLSKPDPNIDHRRVANLMRFFERQKKSLAITNKPALYLPGDIVAWELPSGRLHLGIVSDKKSKDGKRYLLVHNISDGAELEDILFAFKIIGHYRYF